MNDSEAIAAVRRGERAVTSTTLSGFKWAPEICGHVYGWRTVACDDATDVIECPCCGEQRLAKCNFEDECA